jgi:GT2 family glycosyltransferase
VTASASHEPESSAAASPEVTLVVVPRERFNASARSLESVRRHTPPGLRLVYVDGGSPPETARYLAEQSRAGGFELVRTDRFLSPNEARNIGFARASGRYVVFLDNDLLVTSGWLDALVRCAEETGADLVGPLYGVGDPHTGSVHMAGGRMGIREEQGERRLFEEHVFAGRPISEVVGRLRREPTQLVEFHCMLVRTATLQQLGPLDERLLSTGEHIDICLAVAKRGGEIYLEPASRVAYLPPDALDSAEREYFQLRWSEAWTRATFSRLYEKWRLSPRDPYIAQHVRWLRSHRRLALKPVQAKLLEALGPRLARWPLQSLAACEVAWNRWMIRDPERLSARA